MPFSKNGRCGVTFLGVMLALLSGTALADPCDPDRFEVTVPGTVLDKNSGLMWKTCNEGFLFIDGECWGARKHAERGVKPLGTRAYGFQGAKSALYRVDAVNAGTTNTQNFGFYDWRMPSLADMRSLVDKQCAHPALPRDLFPDHPRHTIHWTSTEIQSLRSSVWTVDVDTGEVYSRGSRYNDRTHHLRLVRTND